MLEKLRYKIALWIMPGGEEKTMVKRLLSGGMFYREAVRLYDFIEESLPLKGLSNLSEMVTGCLKRQAYEIEFSLNKTGGVLVRNISSNNPLLEALRRKEFLE